MSVVAVILPSENGIGETLCKDTKCLFIVLQRFGETLNPIMSENTKCLFIVLQNIETLETNAFENMFTQGGLGKYRIIQKLLTTLML